ncbi:MOSC domain-containing protein [Plectosphaerella plurivora]|uniref:MOSC domain-containing protein n=1 Tax=Plectosphaerella plurivora TaxID=936078 RepID=A0A9P8V9B8_9PEZI|nr:MOSC domain-containing protein [Plectosphaerella plurivora]
MSAETLSAGPGTGAADFMSLVDLDPSFFVLPLITLLGFLIPILYIFPPVPATQSDCLSETHVRLGLPRAKSNLKDQHAPRHAGDASASDSKRATLQALSIYPIKSCRGIELDRSRVLPTGLEFDRLYTFAQLKSPKPAAADASEKPKTTTWDFITQRQFPLLATVKVDVWVPNPARRQAAGLLDEGKPGESWIVLRFPWKASGWKGTFQNAAAKLARGWRAVPETEILLPTAFPADWEVKDRGYVYEDVKIWKDVVTALNMKTDLPKELAQYLGVSNPLGLFRVDPGKLRNVYRCASTSEEAGYQPIVGFQDAYPLHLISLGSLQDFGSMVPKDADLKQLDVQRFRANLIISGSPAYDEETWKSLRFKPGTSSLTGNAEFQVACRTVRCKMPNVDPQTGFRHRNEPDRSLRKFREVDEGAPKHGCMGMQVCPLFDDAGNVDSADLRTWVEVGMEIEVVERGDHLYIEQ